jgi:phosphate transport system ATP-binding protein
MSEIIRVENLSYIYNQGMPDATKALDDVSFTVEEGDFVGIIGSTGSGKSTLISHFNGLNRPTSGRVLVDGRDLWEQGADLRSFRFLVGLVMQYPEYQLFEETCARDIAYGPRTHGIHNKAQLDEIVERSLRGAAIWDEVKDRLNKSALGMSGGQQQRLCIARALAVEPEVLLMDEPTSALDPISTSKVEELATELKENYTIVMVTHNMQQAARISDKTAFFLLGELVEMGPTERVFATPVDKRTEDYISGRFG